MECTQVILANDFEVLFDECASGSERMRLSLSEFFEDIDKGGVPLCDQTHVTFVVCRMD